MKLLLIFVTACGAHSTSFRGTSQYTQVLTSTVVSDVNEAAGCDWLKVDQTGMAVETNSKMLKSINERGWTDNVTGRISIEDESESNATSNYTILVHEIGHATGLEHQPGIMEPTFRPMSKTDSISSLVSTAKSAGILNCN